MLKRPGCKIQELIGATHRRTGLGKDHCERLVKQLQYMSAYASHHYTSKLSAIACLLDFTLPTPLHRKQSFRYATSQLAP
jgi:hypothetical protein